MVQKGLMFVLSSPSGTGKTTIARELLKCLPNLRMSISVTTRKKRPAEEDGKDYIFVTQKEFDKMANTDQFIEFARVFDKSYGTPSETVYETLDSGKDVLFDVDWQGAKQLKEKDRENVISIFVLPPSLKVLEKRLYDRGQDSKDTVKKRMAGAISEISHWREYDYILVNEVLAECVKQAESIISVEKLRARRFNQLGVFKIAH